MKGSVCLAVERGVEYVFDFLADLRNEAAWNPRVRAITMITPEPIATGSAFQGRYQGLGSLRTTLVQFDRPTRLAFHSEGQRATIDGIFTISAIGTGTQVTLEADVKPHGLLALAAPLLEPTFRHQNRAAAARLKAALDAGLNLDVSTLSCARRIQSDKLGDPD